MNASFPGPTNERAWFTDGPVSEWERHAEPISEPAANISVELDRLLRDTAAENTRLLGKISAMTTALREIAELDTYNNGNHYDQLYTAVKIARRALNATPADRAPEPARVRVGDHS